MYATHIMYNIVSWILKMMIRKRPLLQSLAMWHAYLHNQAVQFQCVSSPCWDISAPFSWYGAVKDGSNKIQQLNWGYNQPRLGRIHHFPPIFNHFWQMLWKFCSYKPQQLEEAHNTIPPKLKNPPSLEDHPSKWFSNLHSFSHLSPFERERILLGSATPLLLSASSKFCRKLPNLQQFFCHGHLVTAQCQENGQHLPRTSNQAQNPKYGTGEYANFWAP